MSKWEDKQLRYIDDPEEVESMKATERAFGNVCVLHPELDPIADSLVRQKLVETELGIYDPEGQEWEDRRFQAAFERREVPHGNHCPGCHGLSLRNYQ
jgi:hypothetical protein